MLLVGASGMLDSRILAEAAERGHPVIAATAHPDKIASGANVRAVKLHAAEPERSH